MGANTTTLFIIQLKEVLFKSLILNSQDLAAL